jgi:hypothetical protein
MNIFSLLCLMILSSIINPEAQAYTVESYPILEALEKSGVNLSDNTKKWMKRWKNMDLEDSSLFKFNELSGTTSINLKIHKIDSTDEKGIKSLGSFLTKNEAGNPVSEIAYFNLAAILGVDAIFRPAVRYELGPSASLSFKNLINKTPIKGSMRIKNKKNILQLINSGSPLLGCVKAKKSDFSIGYDVMIKINGRNPNGTLVSSHPISELIQAKNRQPQKEKRLLLKSGYTGDEFELSREFSLILTLDSVFGQYDRFSGGNIVIEKNKDGEAHFVATDNGGAYIVGSLNSVKKTLELFSRYDRNAINKIQEFYNFLINPVVPFLGYTDPEKLVVDMGMYTQASPKNYIRALKQNIEMLLNEVKKNELRFGNKAFF